MGVGRAHAIALLGLDGASVEIEADSASGLPAFVLVGLPDAALGEAKARVRSAIGNSGFDFPGGRVTVNLSPASLPKTGAAFDLAIALSLLAAEQIVEPESVARVVHLGELGLDGRLRPVRGILPMVLAAERAGYDTVLVPAGNAEEASLVSGVRVVGVASLRDAAIWHGAEVEPVEVEPLPAAVAPTRDDDPGDLADIVGNREAVEAAQIAAAGGHHMFLLGPPGAGKTMIASRIPGILPDLDEQAAIEVSSIRSLAGLGVGGSLVTRPPLEAPHHSASAAAIVGGGSGIIRPGAAARAAHGILFLDEAPEFAPSVLDSLRQPLESGVLTISRVAMTARFPARFQLVLAANPCPCGNAGVRDAECSCTPFARRRYLGRLSGPLLDRVDIQLDVPRVTAAQLRLSGEEPVTTSAEARARVLGARTRAAARFASTPWRLNAHAPGSWLRGDGAPLPGATLGLDRALERGALTMRGYDRVLRVAWTLADLEGVDRPSSDQIGRALHLRKATA
ncbi:YifB family Mg chelatase-like AAA ATPase [Salinibacterium sp. ZJ70]|uniref:YifB family Mg chelatase-like AAA ATPase n=1 Tax=Salinibacterium sp. ZJ70 TaxID=2708084 RepID=UPI0014242565|nr:YifB family Mg chelatase-like AAA ATPase [Salinibacterium sp. ZJ70]